MRSVIQRVSEASVDVAGETVGAIGRGLLVLVGIGHDDTPDIAQQLADRITRLRIFEDDAGKMNRSLRDVGGSLLAVSQFTLLAEADRGNRPSFSNALPGAAAEPIFNVFCEAVAAAGIPVARGVFGAEMAVRLLNDVPVTIILDWPRRHPSVS